MTWPATAPNLTAVIDIVRRAGCDVADFREPMHSREERNLILDPGEF